MHRINSKEHAALVRSLEQLIDVVSHTANQLPHTLKDSVAHVTEDIETLQGIFLEYETLLEQLSSISGKYRQMHKHLKSDVLAPTLRVLRKQVDHQEQNYFLLRENLVGTKNI